MRQKHWRRRRPRCGAKPLRVCSLLLVLIPGGRMMRWDTDEGISCFAVGDYGLMIVKTVTFSMKFSSKSCLFAHNRSEQLKVTVWYLLKQRLKALSCVTSAHFLNVCVNMGLCHRENEKKRGFILSLHSTKLVYCICCGKAGGRLRGFEWKHISPLAAAAAYPCANSQQMCLGPATPSQRPALSNFTFSWSSPGPSCTANDLSWIIPIVLFQTSNMLTMCIWSSFGHEALAALLWTW